MLARGKGCLCGARIATCSRYWVAEKKLCCGKAEFDTLETECSPPLFFLFFVSSITRLSTRAIRSCVSRYVLRVSHPPDPSHVARMHLMGRGVLPMKLPYPSVRPCTIHPTLTHRANQSCTRIPTPKTFFGLRHASRTEECTQLRQFLASVRPCLQHDLLHLPPTRSRARGDISISRIRYGFSRLRLGPAQVAVTHRA